MSDRWPLQHRCAAPTDARRWLRCAEIDGCIADLVSFFFFLLQGGSSYDSHCRTRAPFVFRVLQIEEHQATQAEELARGANTGSSFACCFITSFASFRAFRVDAAARAGFGSALLRYHPSARAGSAHCERVSTRVLQGCRAVGLQHTHLAHQDTTGISSRRRFVAFASHYCEWRWQPKCLAAGW